MTPTSNVHTQPICDGTVHERERLEPPRSTPRALDLWSRVAEAALSSAVQCKHCGGVSFSKSAVRHTPCGCATCSSLVRTLALPPPPLARGELAWGRWRCSATLRPQLQRLRPHLQRAGSECGDAVDWPSRAVAMGRGGEGRPDAVAKGRGRKGALLRQQRGAGEARLDREPSALRPAAAAPVEQRRCALRSW
jgi:hypothetical protein